jgi:hypothetical protein
MNKRDNKKEVKNKRGVVSDYLPWLLIAIAILAVFSISALLLKDKGIEFIDKILSVFGGR